MWRVISSLHNPRIKAAAKLREARARRKQGRLVIDGAREILRAVQAEVELCEAFVCPELVRAAEAAAAREALASRGVPLDCVTRAVFEKLAYGQRDDGLVVVARAPRRELSELRLPPQALVAVLERIEKPGNVGAILRSADGAGLSAVVVCDPLSDLYNPNTIRASLGTVFSLPVAVASAGECRDWLRGEDLRVYAARLDASLAYSAADFTAGAAIVLGAESSGLSAAWSDMGVVGVRLPMLGQADSLNVASAAAVLFYEARRQRSCPGPGNLESEQQSD